MFKIILRQAPLLVLCVLTLIDTDFNNLTALDYCVFIAMALAVLSSTVWEVRHATKKN